jgi:DNA-directed RNA polymerase specialized sigma24 family protein
MDIPQPERDPMVERLYSLIRHLDYDEQEMILLYLDHYNMVQIAEITNQSYLNTVRRIGRIRKKLRLLNQQLDEED